MAARITWTLSGLILFLPSLILKDYMLDPIQECREKFGRAPRNISLYNRMTYFRVTKPLWLWLNRSDKLHTLLRNKRSLFNNGVVVWGQVVQANNLLFRHGYEDCPGEIVYSLNRTLHSDGRQMQRIASRLFALKGTKPADPSLRKIADYLTDEYTRVFGLDVPKIISPSLKCKISTTFFVRKHLPNQRLCKTLLPVVLSTSAPNILMPLPERYWPDSLLQWWSSAG